MRLILRPLQILYSLYAILVFVIIMFFALPLVTLALLLPAKMRGNTIYIICTGWADLTMFCWGIWHTNIHEVPFNKSHPVIFVFNHISYIDVPILLKALRKYRIRVLGKAEMAKIPVFGFIYKSAVVMVQREDPAHRARSVETLKAALKENISVVIAPEGTFNTTHRPLKEFYDGAFRIAIETNTPIKPVLFLDAYDRLHYNSIFTFTPGRSRAVFLDEVQVAGYTSGNIKQLKQEVYSVMETALVKYNAGWIKK